MGDGSGLILKAIRIGDELLDRGVVVWTKVSEAFIAAGILGVALGATLAVAVVGGVAMLTPRVVDRLRPLVRWLVDRARPRARVAQVAAAGRAFARAVGRRVLADDPDLDDPDAVAAALATGHANALALDHALDIPDRARSRTSRIPDPARAHYARARERLATHAGRVRARVADIDRYDVDHVVLRTLDVLTPICARLVNGGAHALAGRVATSTWWPAVVAVVAVSRVSPQPVALGVLAGGVVAGLATAWRWFLQLRDDETEWSTSQARGLVEDVLRDDLGVDLDDSRVLGGSR